MQSADRRDEHSSRCQAPDCCERLAELERVLRSIADRLDLAVDLEPGMAQDGLVGLIVEIEERLAA